MQKLVGRAQAEVSQMLKLVMIRPSKFRDVRARLTAKGNAPAAAFVQPCC